MRLSSAQIFQQGISAILEQQGKLQRTQEQLASGRRVLTPSDDPVAAVQILDISEDLAQVDQYNRNGDLAQGQLALEESVLADVGTVLQRVRELVLQANNATQSPDTRQSIATEISARLDELQALANTRDASDEFIFAGFQSENEPFVRQGDVYSYQGDDGQRFLQLASNTQVAVRDSGRDVFMSVPTGNGVFDVQAAAGNAGTAVAGTRSLAGSFVPDTYTITFSQVLPTDPVSFQVVDSAAGVVAAGNYAAGEAITFAGANIRFDGVPADGDSFDVSPSVRQDMFSTLQDIVATLEGAGATAPEVAALNNALGQSLENLDGALDHVLQVRADVGVRLQQVDSQRNLNDNFNLQLQESLSDVQDLDYAEAISRLNLQLASLEAAQQAYVRVQGLSLFNYL
jgi:flagellar hook-associated protein 3 FlgL